MTSGEWRVVRRLVIGHRSCAPKGRLVIGHPSEGAEPRDRILEVLGASPSYVSGQAITKELGFSRTAVFKHVATLRREGYTIEAKKGAGYRLAQRTWRLLPREILRHGLPLPWVRRWVYRETLGSTNDLAKQLAETSAPSGTVVIAEEQRAGRGRRGRQWVAPAGSSLLLSLVLRPAIGPGRIGLYSLAAAEAAAQAIERSTGLAARTKWPNDVLVGGRKVGGVLIEISAQAEQVHYMVIGIGINCLQRAEDFPKELNPKSKIQNPKSKIPRAPATSLAIEAGTEIDRSRVCAHLLQALGGRVGAEGEILEEVDLLRSWRKLDVCLGREVTISGAGETLGGRALRVDADGALWIRPASGGDDVRVVAGDVSLCASNSPGISEVI